MLRERQQTGVLWPAAACNSQRHVCIHAHASKVILEHRQAKNDRGLYMCVNVAAAASCNIRCRHFPCPMMGTGMQICVISEIPEHFGESWDHRLHGKSAITGKSCS